MRRRASLSITTTVAISRPHAYKEWQPPRLPTPRFRKTVPFMIARNPLPPVPALSFFEADTPVDDMVLARVFGELTGSSPRGVSSAGYLAGGGDVEVVLAWDEGSLESTGAEETGRRASLPARLEALARLTGSKGPAAPRDNGVSDEVSQAEDEWTGDREHRRRSQSVCHASGSTTDSPSEAPPLQSSDTLASILTLPSTLNTPSPSPPPQNKPPHPAQTHYRSLPSPLLPLPSPSPLPVLSPRFLFPRTPPLPPTLRAWTSPLSEKRERIGWDEVAMSPVRLCFRCSGGDVRKEKLRGDGERGGGLGFELQTQGLRMIVKGMERGVGRKKGTPGERRAGDVKERRMRGGWGVGLCVVLVRRC